jgi:hypothetical protein
MSVSACCVRDPVCVTAPGLGISVPPLELPFLGRHTSDVCNVYCTEAGDLVFCRMPGLLCFMLLYLSYTYFRGALVVQRGCISDMLPEA